MREYVCVHCGHGFPWFIADGPHPLCPRCGSRHLHLVPWLLGSPEAGDLTPEDHYAAVLAV